MVPPFTSVSQKTISGSDTPADRALAWVMPTVEIPLHPGFARFGNSLKPKAMKLTRGWQAKPAGLSAVCSQDLQKMPAAQTRASTEAQQLPGNPGNLSPGQQDPCPLKVFRVQILALSQQTVNLSEPEFLQLLASFP